MLSDLLEQTTWHLTENNYSKISPVAEELLAEHKITLAKQSPAYQRLCRELLKAQQQVFKIEMERWEGRYWGEGAYFQIARNGGLSSKVVDLSSSLSIEQAINLYFDHYQHRDKRTNLEKKMVIQRFIESLSDGARSELNKITKADCIRYRDSYSQLPRRIPNRHRKKPLYEIIDGVRADQPEYTKVTKSTVNHALTDLRHFFAWAIRHDHYTGRNPVSEIDYEGVLEQSYEPYSDDEIQRLFASDEFLRQKTVYPARYWLPLVLVYTGARREEIAQLSPSDVRQDSTGLWYFDITPDIEQGKRLKNKGSKRRVPVHSRLLELGLLNIVEQATKERRKYVFPKPEARKKRGIGRETAGDAVSKWFARVRDEAMISGRKTLHSFRHTVVTRLTAAGVPQDMREMLVGHASESVHGQVYTHREAIPLALLREHLEKLKYTF